jgi:hypothetical protein
VAVRKVAGGDVSAQKLKPNAPPYANVMGIAVNKVRVIAELQMNYEATMYIRLVNS